MHEIRPQPGPQTEFLSTSADIAIYGGSAGSGKSFALLLEPLRNVSNPDFFSVTFRRTGGQITMPGGLWDTSMSLYPHLNARPIQTSMTWRFKGGSKVKFSHMEHEKDRLNWQGSQIPLIMFDELTHFEESQFWYMMGRCRSMSGIPGYIRASTNPQCMGWVKDLIAWWLDKETGFPINERSGVLRWFARDGDTMVWTNTKEELVNLYGPSSAKSLTFIPANIQDNQILLARDPAYLANLKALPFVDRCELLDGNWNVERGAGSIFSRYWFEAVPCAPVTVLDRVRVWDRAATKFDGTNDPDWTAGVLLSRNTDGMFFVEDVVHMRETPLEVERAMENTAQQDGPRTRIIIFQDPGSAGVKEADDMVRKMARYSIKVLPCARGSGENSPLVTLSKPASAQAERGNVKLVKGRWNPEFLDELNAVPIGRHDDMAYAFAAGLMDIVGPGGGALTSASDVHVGRADSPLDADRMELAGSRLGRNDF